ncbi:MAG TPA: Pycsar system effector family protein [Herbaspirillum sp.]|uniref:Pycsar system effector family protein n=1 Tax=Herbaspirillum sp. TaxID=1890675 RepID=UPI002D488AC4|nr:Pycsar system effector family protein [Herbaspirillum sp.]HZG18854.1 Pycsar system effector family protein [Herbaspirillum sp.]
MSKEKISTAQWVLERQINWIATADVKVGVLITLDVAMLGGLAAAFTQEDSYRSMWLYHWCGAAVIFLTLSIACAAFAVFPRLGAPKPSLLFFGSVNSRPMDEYVKLFKDATDDQILEDWSTQIYRNAQIASQKHHWVRWALKAAFAGALPWLVSIGLLVK